MRPLPYISISGVMDGKGFVEAFEEDEDPPTRLLYGGLTGFGHELALGVLVSRKTLTGEGNKYPLRYLPIADAWKGTAPYGAKTFVHYSQDDGDGLGDALVDAVAKVERTGREVHGVQVNVHLPGREHLAYFARTCPDKRIILQFGPRMVGGDMPTAATLSYLLQYGWSVTDVLIDGSAGTGRPLDVVKLAELVASISTLAPHLGIGIAGGLCEETLYGTVERLLVEYPRLSLCAEGALRDDAPGGGNLVIPKALAYVKRAQAIFESALGAD